MQQRLFISLGALSFFLGFPNTFIHIPLLVMIYPYTLCLLGEHAITWRNAFYKGWFCGTLGATAIMSWVIVPINEVAGIPFILAVPFAVMVGAYIGLYAGAFAALTCLSRSLSLYLRVLFLGLSWYLLEYLRGVLFTGLPWASLSAAFVPWPVYIQGASIIGAYALSGVFTALAIIPVLAKHTRAAWFCVVFLFAGLTFAGQQYLQQIPSEASSHTKHSDESLAEPLSITMIQGNINQNIKWNSSLQRQITERYIQLTNEALSALEPTTQMPQLIIWPETAMPFDAERNTVLALLLQQLVTKHRTALLFGAPGFARLDASRYTTFNRAYLFTPTMSGQKPHTSIYEKEQLVPFGEYMPPSLDIPFLRPLLQGIGNFTTGQQTAPLSLTINPHKAEKLGVLICYEAVFPELARNRVAEGASIFINISNDAWFGKTAAAEQHLQLSAMRAVEQYRPIARATNTGITSFIDPHGRITKRTKLFEATSLTDIIMPQKQYTLFYRIEPILALVSLGGFMALCFIMFVRRKRQPTTLR